MLETACKTRRLLESDECEIKSIFKPEDVVDITCEQLQRLLFPPKKRKLELPQKEISRSSCFANDVYSMQCNSATRVAPQPECARASDGHLSFDLEPAVVKGRLLASRFRSVIHEKTQCDLLSDPDIDENKLMALSLEFEDITGMSPLESAGTRFDTYGKSFIIRTGQYVNMQNQMRKTAELQSLVEFAHRILSTSSSTRV